jgi:hypothetical protein
MPELLILDFPGVTEAEYRNVNAQLGVDQDTGAGEWPPGIVSHTAGATDGHFYVVEVWESREAQAAFMHGRLGAALAADGIAVEPAVTWARVVGHQTPAG